MVGKQLGSLSMGKRQGEGEELCEMAAVHLAPNICFSSDGLGVAAVREEGEICCVGKTAARHDWSSRAGRDGEWMQTLQCSGSHFPLNFWVVLYQLLNTTASAQLIIVTCRSRI